LEIAACLSALASAERSHAQVAPPPALETIDFLDGETSLLARAYHYELGRSGRSIEIPAGFVTDFTSIPRKLRSFLDSHGRYSRAAVVHDFLYWAQPCSRGQADNILMIAMKQSGVPADQRYVIYKGVDLFGNLAWKSNQHERNSGVTHVVPSGDFGMTDTMTWSDARMALLRQGARDPDFHVDQAFCALGNSQELP
jgi:hypothetical protein